MAYNVGTASIHIKPDLEDFREDLKEQWETMRKEAADTGEWDMTPGLDTSHLDKAMSDWRDGAAKDFSKDFKVEGLVDVSLDPASMREAESQASKIAAKVHKKISTGDLVDTDALNHTITVDGIAALNKGFSAAKTNLQGVVDLENARADALERAASAAEAVDNAEASQRSNADSATETLRMMDRHARKLQQAQAREASTRSDLTTFNLGAADAAYRMHKKGDKSGLVELARQREALKEANATASQTVTSMSRIISNDNNRLTSLQKIGAQLAKNAADSQSAWEAAETSSIDYDHQVFARRQEARDHVKTITSGYRQFDSGIDVKKINKLLTRELTRNPNEGAGTPYRSSIYTPPENSFDAAHQANPGALPVKMVDFNSSYSPDTENSSGVLGAIQSELVSARRVVTETSKQLRSNMVAAADAWDNVDAIQRVRDGWSDEFDAYRDEAVNGYIPDSTRELSDLDKRDRAGFDLYEKLSKTNKYQQYGSDAWKMYYETLPKQAENNRIERENILERDRVAKLENDRLWKTAHTARDYMFAAGNRVDAAAEKARAADAEIHESQRSLSEAKRYVHEGEVALSEAKRSVHEGEVAERDASKAKARGEVSDVDTSGLKDLKVELGTIGRMALRASLQGAGLGIIGLAASGAIPGVAALGSAIGNVGKLAGLLPAMVGAGAVAVGVFALATNGVVESISSLSDTLGEDGLPVMGDYAEATKDMSDQMKSLADSIYLVGDGATQSLSQGFDSLRDSVQDKFIDHIVNGMDTIQQRLMSMGGIDDLSDSLTKLGGNFGRIVQNWANFRFSDSGWADMNTQLGNFEALSESIVSTIGKWQYAWNDLSTVGSTFLPEIGRGLDGVTGKFSNFIANARDNGDMAQWFRSGIDSAEQLGSMIGSSFGIVRNVFKATSGDLDDLNDKMEAGLKSTEDYTSSLAGKDALKDFFSDTSAMGSEMVKSVVAFGKSIAEHVVPVLSEFTQGLGPELREAIETSGGLMDAIAPSARTLGEAVGEMATGFMRFGTWLEPFVSSTLPIFANVIEFVAPAIGALIGPLAHLIALRGVLSIFDKLGEYLGVISSFAGGRTLSRIAALVGAGLTLSNAFSPIGDILKGIVGGLESFNDLLGGMPARALTLITALKAVQNAGGFGAVSRKVAGFAGFGRGLDQVEKNATGAAKSVTLLGTNMKTGQRTANLYAQSLKQTFARAKSDSLAASGAIAGQAGAWKTLKANASGSMANIKKVMSPMRGAVSGMGKSLAGLGSGLMGAFGGPWGLAVVAGTGAVLAGIDANKGYKRSLEQIADQAKITGRAQREVADSMLGGSTAKEAYGSVFSEFDEKTAAIASDDNNAWGDTSAWLYNHGLADGITGDGQEAADKGKAAADAQKYQKALKDLGYTAEDTGEAASKSSSQWEAYREELENNGAPEAYMEKLDALREKAREGEASFQKLSEETKSASRAFAELAESGGASSGDLNKLRGALSGLRGTSSEAATATSQLTRVLDSTAQSADSVAGATLDAAGNIDTTATAGVSLYDALSQVGDAMGTAVENGNSASSVWDQAQGSLESLRESAGLGETEWQNLLDKMNMTPERIETLMVVKTNTALTEIEGVNQAIKQAQENGLSEVQLNLTDEEATSFIKDSLPDGAELNKLTEGVWSLKLDADTSSLDEKISHGIDQLRLFSTMEPKPFLDVRTDMYSQKMRDAIAEAAGLDSATPEAIADLDITKLGQNNRMALGSLVNLDNMSVWPSVSVRDDASGTIEALERGLSEVPDANVNVGVNGDVQASEAISAIGESVKFLPDGSIDIDSSSADWALDTLERLGAISIDDEGTITVNDNGGELVLGILDGINASVGDKYQKVVTEHIERYTTVTGGTVDNSDTYFGGVNGGAARDAARKATSKADGGRLPKNSNGNRLPTTGPGTDRTDGILGVAADGTPMSWVDAGEWIVNAKSSEKHDGLLRAINEDRLPALAGGGTAPGKGRKKDNASIWQDVVTGIATGASNGATNSVNNHVSGTLNGIGTIADGVDLSGISGDTVNKVREVFARHGWGGQQWDDAQWIIGKESGWNLSATNPSSGAFGLFQFNPSSGTQQQYLPDRSTDATVQGDAGARYIKDRYGNPTAARGFWEQNGWYDNGGWLKTGVTRVTNETGKPEPVFNPGQWDIIRNNIAANSAIVEAINSNDSWAASQARVNAQHEETLADRAARESANNDDDPDNDIEDEEITPVISMKQWDQIAASVNTKVRAGDVDGVRGELSNVFDILSEAAEQVDWADVMEQPVQDTVDGMIKGQADDALGVFGMSGVDSIPAVAASKKFQEDTQAQREKEDDDLKESKKDYTDADENIQSKQESLDSAKEDLAKLQEDLAGLTDADEIADKQDQIKDKQESVAKLEKDLRKAKDDKQKALDSANRLSADAYTGNSDLPLDDYVDPDAAAKKEKKERDERIAAKKEAERLEKKIQKKAVGGWITGPGGPTADIIPLLASAGEFMVRASSASNAPHLLNAINSDPGAASNLNEAFTGKIGNESAGNSGDTYEFHIHANSVDEGMRRADAYKRQQVAAHNPRR